MLKIGVSNCLLKFIQFIVQYRIVWTEFLSYKNNERVVSEPIFGKSADAFRTISTFPSRAPLNETGSRASPKRAIKSPYNDFFKVSSSPFSSVGGRAAALWYTRRQTAVNNDTFHSFSDLLRSATILACAPQVDPRRDLVDIITATHKRDMSVNLRRSPLIDRALVVCAVVRTTTASHRRYRYARVIIFSIMIAYLLAICKTPMWPANKSTVSTN